MHLDQYLSMLKLSEDNLTAAFTLVAARHDRDHDVHDTAGTLAAWSRQHSATLEQYIAKYGADASKNEQVQLLRGALFHGTRIGGMGLLADLQDLALLTSQANGLWTIVWQTAKALHDAELQCAADEACKQGDRQLAWIKTTIKIAGPQAIVVPAAQEAQLAAALPTRQTPATQQDLIWAPLAAGGLMAVVGILALLAGLLSGLGAGLPWLFPSLGPSAYLQAESPAHPASRFYNTVVGHTVGLVAGFVGVFLFGAYDDPAVMLKHELSGGRVAAAALALALTLVVALLLKASHLPAGATTLLVALGAFKFEDVPAVIAGVLIIAVAGELLRRMRLGQLTARPARGEQLVPAPKPQS